MRRHGTFDFFNIRNTPLVMIGTDVVYTTGFAKVTVTPRIEEWGILVLLAIQSPRKLAIPSPTSSHTYEFVYNS